jgi:hypothetical protein
MVNFDIAADTGLGQRALEAAATFVADAVSDPVEKEDEWPISRSQIAGLRQIASIEPSKVKEFADNQRTKAANRLEGTTREDKKRKLENEVNFWLLVKALCDGGPAARGFSLADLRKQAVRERYPDESLPPGAQLTAAQQAERKAQKDERLRWERDWDHGGFSTFFQRFCAELVFRLTERTTGN